MRFEIHVNRMDNVNPKYELKNIDVNEVPEPKTLSDLCKIPVLEKLGKRLISEFKEIIIAEPMATDLMKPKELKCFHEMNSISYWRQFKENKDREGRRVSKKKFNALTAKYGNGLKSKTLLLIAQKWNELLELNVEADFPIIEKKPRFAVVHEQIPIKQNKVISPRFAVVHEQKPINENKSISPHFAVLDIAVKRGINETIPLEKIEVLKKCSSCKKVLKIGVIKYCDLKCELDKGKRNNSSNQNHKTKAQLKKLAMQPTLFSQGEYLKIDQSKINWLQQQGFTIKSL